MHCCAGAEQQLPSLEQLLLLDPCSGVSWSWASHPFKEEQERNEESVALGRAVLWDKTLKCAIPFLLAQAGWSWSSISRSRHRNVMRGLIGYKSLGNLHGNAVTCFGPGYNVDRRWWRFLEGKKDHKNNVLDFFIASSASYVCCVVTWPSACELHSWCGPRSLFCQAASHHCLSNGPEADTITARLIKSWDTEKT